MSGSLTVGVPVRPQLVGNVALVDFLATHAWQHRPMTPQASHDNERH